MARTTINSLGVPAGTITAADLSYPLTDFSSTGIDDNATSTALTVHSNENVGIGTTTDSYRLHVYHATNDAPLLIDTGSSNGAHLRFGSSGTVKHYIGSGGGIALGDHEDLTIRAFDNILVATGNSSTERMRINSSGNLLVGGTTDRSRKFVVEGTGDLAVLYSTNDGAGGAQLDLIQDSSSKAADDAVGIINFSTDTRQFSSIRGIAHDHTNGYGQLRFGVRQNTSTYNHNAMTLDELGNLLVGVTSTTYGLSNRREFQLYGSQEAIITLDTGNASPFYINNNNGGADIWNQNNNYMRFGTNSAERVRIDAAGDVYIGNNGSAATRVVEISGTNTGTNPAANGHIAGELRFRNVSSTDNNHSAISWYNSNNAVDSRITGVHKSHSSRYGELAFLTHDGSALGERMRITSGGNVGIGTAAAATIFHIIDSNPILRLQSNGAGTDNAINFLSRNISNVAAYADIIGLGAGHNSTNAAILFTQGSGQTERMRIDTSGRTVIQGGVSYTANAPSVRGNLIIANAASNTTTNGGLEFMANSGGGAGYGARISADSSGGIRFETRTNNSNWTQRASFSSSGGLCFNTDSATANALDDYEEGSWTPAFGSGTLTVNSATYTKIGRQVTCQFYISGSTACSGDISGLPFTPNGESAGVVGYQTNTAGETYGILVQAANVWNFRIGSTQYGLGAGKQARGMFTYFTNS